MIFIDVIIKLNCLVLLIYNATKHNETPDMKSLKATVLALSTLSLAHFAHADMIGVYGSVDYWHLQGDYNEAGTGSALNDQNKLDWEDKGQVQAAISIEHPVPLIPNARIRHVGIEAQTEQKQVLSNASMYETNLDNTDLILYYEILDNIVSVDLGVAAKRIDGDITYLDTLNVKDKLKISETAAMVYGSVGAKLPFTGLSAKAEVLATSYGDIEISDVSAEIKYDFIDNILIDVGAKAGYRYLDMKLDDQENIDTHFTFHGPYVGLEVHF